jgi:predicted oxidoreductase
MVVSCIFWVFSIFRTFTEESMLTVLQEHAVSERVRSLTTLASHDYVDAFTVTTSAAEDWSAAQWARAAVDFAAGLAGQFVWRVLLGLRLEPRSSPDYVAGWRVVGRDDSEVVLEAASWFLTAQIVVRVGDGQVTVGTFIRYDRLIAALIWPPLSVGHRRAMPGLLRQAVRILTFEGIAS